MSVKLLATALLCAALTSTAFAATEIPTHKTNLEKSETKEEKKSPYISSLKLLANKATIQRVEEYLSSLTTIEADFVQSSSDGSVGEGKFYLQRPGKMRWQYAPPAPILIVSSGSELVYYDKELEQVTYIPIADTLAGFLAQEKIVFDGAVGIEEISNEAGIIRITISQRDKPDDGKLTLELTDKPLELKRMVVRDAAGGETNVALSDAQFGVELKPELFVFRDPRKKRVK